MTPPTPFPPYKTAPVAALIPYARNARTHSDAQVARIAASIREFGFTNPILVDGDRGVIAGHGRLLAARQLGLAEVPTIELAHLTPAQRRAYVLADNRLALDAGWDEAMLKIELGELQAEGFDLALTGFEPDEIGKLLIDAGDGLTVGRTGRLRADRHRRLRRANRARGAAALRAAGARPGAALRPPKRMVWRSAATAGTAAGRAAGRLRGGAGACRRGRADGAPAAAQGRAAALHGPCLARGARAGADRARRADPRGGAAWTHTTVARVLGSSGVGGIEAQA